MEEGSKQEKTKHPEIFEERPQIYKDDEASNCEGKSSVNNKLQDKKLKKYDIHKEGKWKQEEDQIYVSFILSNRDKFASKTIRRSTRVFRQLAEILEFTRTPEQCRMHHQRMKKKARGRSISAIAKFIERKYMRKRNAGGFESEGNERFEKEKEMKDEIEKTRSSAPQYKMKFNKVGGFSISISINNNILNEW